MRKLIIILLTLSFWSCVTTPLDVVIPQQEAKTVVFSQVIPNQIMVIALSKSFGALDLSEDNGDSISEQTLNQLLEDSAIVTIAYGNNEDTLFRIEKGLYASINTPQQPNLNYRLRIINDKGEVVESESEMLQQVDFDFVTPLVNRGSDTTTEISYEFTDIPGNNWYMVNYYQKNPTAAGVDVNTIFNNGENALLRTDLISDETFDGVYQHTAIFETFELAPTDTIAVTLSNINQDYFNFLSQRVRSGNIFSEITNEPINYPTNVTNGYGFFNTHSPDINIFDLNQY